MKKYIFITGLLCLIFNLSLAQSTLNGRVTDSEDKSPLAGVNIILKNTQKGTTTNSEGGFSLALPQGTTEIVVSYLGFKTQILQITDASQFLEIALEASNLNLNEITVTLITSENFKIIRKLT